MDTNLKIFFIIIFLGLILRLWKIDLPLLEFYPSRQVQTAEISRNFYRNGFNILKPEVGYLGEQKSPFAVEFPLFNFIVAVLYKLTGGVHEYLGRLLSIVGWILSSIFLYLITKKYANESIALITLFFFAFSPISILVSRSFQPDMWMLTFSIVAIYLIDKWRTNRQITIFTLSSLATSCAILVKIHAVIFTLVPIIYIFYSVKKSSKFLVLFYLGISIIPAILWYSHAKFLNQNTPGLWENSEIANWFGFEVFLNQKYYSNIFGFEYNLVLLPIGIILFLIGLLTKLKRNQYFLYVWLVGIMIYFLLFNKHNMTHEYYHLPFLPIASVFIGIGLEKIIKNTDKLILPKNISILILISVIILTMLPSTFARAYKPIDRFSSVVETGQAIQKITNTNDLIIGLMDAGPTLMYYADRKGWEFEINSSRIQKNKVFFGINDKRFLDPVVSLENFRAKGAQIFAAANKEQLFQNQYFLNYLYSNYKVFDGSQQYIIFDLRK